MTIETPLRAGFAFSAGVATFFAPCAYPLLPGYVAYFLGRDDEAEDDRYGPRLWTATKVAGLACLGFVVVFSVLAAVALLVGTPALGNIGVLELVVGGLLVVLGVGMASGRLRLGTVHLPLPARRRSTTGFLGFGVIYAVAAAGCTAPVFTAIAAVAIAGGPAATVLTLGAYAAGMAIMMLSVTLLAALGRDGLLRRLPTTGTNISRVAGGLLVLAGLAQIYLYVFDFDWLGVLRLI